MSVCELVVLRKVGNSLDNVECFHDLVLHVLRPCDGLDPDVPVLLVDFVPSAAWNELNMGDEGSF